MDGRDDSTAGRPWRATEELDLGNFFEIIDRIGTPDSSLRCAEAYQKSLPELRPSGHSSTEIQPGGSELNYYQCKHESSLNASQLQRHVAGVDFRVADGYSHSPTPDPPLSSSLSLWHGRSGDRQDVYHTGQMAGPACMAEELRLLGERVVASRGWSQANCPVRHEAEGSICPAEPRCEGYMMLDPSWVPQEPGDSTQLQALALSTPQGSWQSDASMPLQRRSFMTAQGHGTHLEQCHRGSKSQESRSLKTRKTEELRDCQEACISYKQKRRRLGRRLPRRLSGAAEDARCEPIGPQTSDKTSESEIWQQSSEPQSTADHPSLECPAVQAEAPGPFLLADPNLLHSTRSSAAAAWSPRTAEPPGACVPSELQRWYSGRKRIGFPVSAVSQAHQNPASSRKKDPVEVVLPHGDHTAKPATGPRSVDDKSQDSQTIGLLIKSTTQLLAIASSSTRNSHFDMNDPVWDSWRELQVKVSRRRQLGANTLRQMMNEQNFVQEYERKLNMLLSSIEQLHLPGELPVRREVLALQLLLELNEAPPEYRMDSNINIGGNLVEFCSMLELDPGWKVAAAGNNLTVPELLALLSGSASLAGHSHRMTLNGSVLIDCSLQELLSNPRRDVQSQIAECAAVLSALQTQMSQAEGDIMSSELERNMTQIVLELSVPMLTCLRSQPWTLVALTSLNETHSSSMHSDAVLWAEVADAAKFNEEQKQKIISLHQKYEGCFKETRDLKMPIKLSIQDWLSSEAGSRRSGADQMALTSAVELKRLCTRQAICLLELGATLLLSICSPLQVARMIGVAWPCMLEPSKIAAVVSGRL